RQPAALLTTKTTTAPILSESSIPAAIRLRLRRGTTGETMKHRFVQIVTWIACVLSASPLLAQQRPLVTEDPEPIGAGRVLVEGGIDLTHDEHYPVSGLKGNLTRLPTIGISVGLSSIAELQIDGGFYQRLTITDRSPAPLSSELTVVGGSTHDVMDTIVATKIRIIPEAESRPAIGIRFATKLPNASNEAGLGLDTTDFFATLL